MPQDVLIPILGCIVRTRPRREIDPAAVDGWYKQSYNINSPLESRVRRLHIWLDEFTKGRFYLSAQTVAFEDEKDFTIFKLWYKDNSEIV
jgi:hypothetical protein